MSEMQETWVQSLELEDSPGEGMATHSSILAWKIPWTEEQAGCSPRGHEESDATEQLSMHTHKSISPCIRKPRLISADWLYHMQSKHTYFDTIITFLKYIC